MSSKGGKNNIPGAVTISDHEQVVTLNVWELQAVHYNGETQMLTMHFQNGGQVSMLGSTAALNQLQDWMTAVTHMKLSSIGVKEDE